MRKRSRRTCPQNPAQDGVCGCPLFWKRGRRACSSSVHAAAAATATGLAPDHGCDVGIASVNGTGASEHDEGSSSRSSRSKRLCAWPEHAALSGAQQGSGNAGQHVRVRGSEMGGNEESEQTITTMRYGTQDGDDNDDNEVTTTTTSSKTKAKAQAQAKRVQYWKREKERRKIRKKKRRSKRSTEAGVEMETEMETEMQVKVGMGAMPVRILVDYELPCGSERLDWDTDQVRRMVGEIA